MGGVSIGGLEGIKFRDASIDRLIIITEKIVYISSNNFMQLQGCAKF
jgi:hypothetical protein